jgi:hypothetical protein
MSLTLKAEEIKEMGAGVTGAEFSGQFVTFTSGGLRLAGKLLLPDVPYPVPGAILCHGLASSDKALEPNAQILAGQG